MRPLECQHYLYNGGRFPKYPPIEFPSLTKPDVTYTVVYWSDGEIEVIGSPGFASQGHDRGSIGTKIIHHGIGSLKDKEMKYVLKRIPKKIIREFLDGGD